MADDTEAAQRRDNFLIAMYGQLMNDINRHIVVVWQSVGVLFAAMAGFVAVGKGVISVDVVAAFIIGICAWMIAHIYDAAYWYNRNLVIIANIERQFLYPTDTKDIHFYFAEHRAVASMLTHLAIQKWLALGVATCALIFHLIAVIVPGLCHQDLQWTMGLPWIAGAAGLYVWWHERDRGIKRYKHFLAESPGKTMDTSNVRRGPSHPTGSG